MNANGELISGAIAAPAPGDVAQRIERLGLVLVDNVTPEEGGVARGALSLFNRPTAEDVTIFTRDLALLLRAGARINDGLAVLGAAGCVLLFFLTFVLPQFASVLQDFGAKVDPIVGVFLNISTFLRGNSEAVLAGLTATIAAAWLLLRQERVRSAMTNAITRL